MTLIISGTTNTGVTLSTGDGPVIVTATAYLGNGGGGGEALVAPVGATWNITNFGLILGASAGIYLKSSGTVANMADGLITGADGIAWLEGNGTVTNAGIISGTGIYGIRMDLGGSVTNQSTGTISGVRDAVGEGRGGTVSNAGDISGGQNDGVAVYAGVVANQSTGTISGGFDGVYVGDGGTITNAGTILAINNYGIEAVGGATVINQASGTISGAEWGIGIELAAGTVTNAGGVTGTNIYGVALFNGGTVTNQASGTIEGFDAAVVVRRTTGTVTNAGVVTGSDLFGIWLPSGGEVTNQSTGQISAEIGVFVDGAGTVTNAGTITGSISAIVLASGYTNLVIVDPGAVFSGSVDGGNATGAASISTLELAAGATSGLLSGLGVQFTGFAQIAIDAGALWTLTGTNALVAGTTITNAGGLTVLDGSLSDAGTVINDDGIQDDAPVLTVGTLTGNGQVLIGDASTLTLSGSVAAGETVAFAGDGLLALAPAAFSGQIDGFGEGGRRMELLGMTDATSAGIVSGNTLAIQRSGGPAIDLTLDPTQNYTGIVFPIATAGANQFVSASGEIGPTLIDQGETESVTGAAGSALAAIVGGVGGITVTGANSLLTTTLGAFIVGDTGLGRLSVETGGSVNARLGLVVADTSGASGSSVDVSGAGSSLTVTSGLVVGDAGAGALSLSEGGAATTDSLDIAALATGDGDVSLSGTGTTLDVTGSVTLGGQSAGELSILGGAQMTVGGGVVGSGDSAPGDLDIEGAGSRLTINTGTLVVGASGPAEFTLGIGAALRGELAIGPFGIVNEYGDVDPPTDPNDGTQNVGFGNSLIYDFFVANSGTIKITSGTATFYTPLVTDETNAADGSTNGLWVIGAHDTLVMNTTSVDNTQTFDFTSPSAASLVIGQVPQGDPAAPDTFNGQTMPCLTGSIAPGAANVLPGWNAPIENYQSGDAIVLRGLTYRSATASGDVVTVWSGAGGTGTPLGSLTFITKGLAPGSSEAAAAATQINTLACFAKGTRIETVHGPVAVERLRVGDTLRTHDGRHEPIVFLGFRTVNCARHPRPESVYPVRVSAGAFGGNVPCRELYLSPDHALFVNDVLVPVRLLINGTSITQVKRHGVTYYHVELPDHAVILAEGLPVESYLDTGDRTNFDRSGIIRLHPDFTARPAPDAATRWETRGAAPLVMAGAMLEAARAGLPRMSHRMVTRGEPRPEQVDATAEMLSANPGPPGSRPRRTASGRYPTF